MPKHLNIQNFDFTDFAHGNSGEAFAKGWREKSVQII
jgi:hypothetical protein